MIAHLPSAAFVAIDEEMTGIQLPSAGRPRKDLTPTALYTELKRVPERYSIIQLGVTLFSPIDPEEDEDGEIRLGNEEPERDSWRVRRYNFYTFPHKDSARDVVLSPSAADFLSQHNMSYDTWVKQGVTCTNTVESSAFLQDYIVERVRKDEEARQPPPSPTVQQVARRVELRKTEDVEFFSRSMANLREWLDQPWPVRADTEGAAFLLPACNSFMRRAFYESISREYPALVLENAGPERPHQIRVWRLNEEEKRQRDARLRRQDWENALVQRVGLTRVFAALSAANHGFPCNRHTVLFAPSLDQVDWSLAPNATLERGRRIPMVVHNGFMDLAFLMTHFVTNELPDTLGECKHMITDFFPLVYDTKIMATEHSLRQHDKNTGLEALFHRIGDEGEVAHRMENMVLGTGVDDEDQPHEAAYDAYMTGVCFIGLCHEIRETYGVDGLQAETHQGPAFRVGMGRNKLYQMSMYTMDLEDLETDPMARGLSPDSTYRVSGIDPAVTTRDLVRCLSNLEDEDQHTVAFEIVWIDDTTFLAGANYREGLLGRGTTEAEQAQGQAVLRTHGKIIERALVRRFSRHAVQRLDNYLAAEELKEASSSSLSSALSLWTRVTRYLGWGGKRKLMEDDAEEAGVRAPKRRRIR